MDFTQLLASVLPTVIALVTAQKVPAVPVPEKGETVTQKMGLLAATIAILTAVQAATNGHPDQIDTVQFVAALGVVYAVLPRAHQLADAVIAKLKK